MSFPRNLARKFSQSIWHCIVLIVLLSSQCFGQTKYVLISTFVPHFGLDPGGRPFALTIDSSGDVYVTASKSEADKYTSTGKWLVRFGTDPTEVSSDPRYGTLECPDGIALDSAGNVYVTDISGSLVQKYSPEGDFLGTLSVSGVSVHQPSAPTDIAIDQSGKFYVACVQPPSIQEFSADGIRGPRFGTLGNGPGQIQLLRYIALDRNRILIGDEGNHRIEIFKTDGTFVNEFGSQGTGPGKFTFLSGVAVDSSHNIYVSDSTRVEKFDQFGNYITSIADPILQERDRTGSNQYAWQIEGIAVDSLGDVFVSDNYNDRIDVFKPASGPSLLSFRPAVSLSRVSATSVGFGSTDEYRERLRDNLRGSVSKFNPNLFTSVDPNSQAAYGKTWVQYAASMGNGIAVKWMLDHGFPPDAGEPTNSSIIMAIQGHLDSVIPALIRHGAACTSAFPPTPFKPNDPWLESDGRTPLDAAAESGDVKAAQELLAAGASVNEISPVLKDLESGKTAMLPEMLSKPRPLNDHTPLLADAAKLGNVEMVRLLLSYKAPSDMEGTIDIPGVYNPAARYPAGINQGEFEMQESAIAITIAEPIAKKLPNSTIIPDGISHPPYNNISEALLKAGSRVRLPPARRELVLALLKGGYSASIRNAAFPYTPLFFAIACDDMQTVQLLIAHGATIDPDIPSDVLANQLWMKRHPKQPLPFFQF